MNLMSEIANLAGLGADPFELKMEILILLLALVLSQVVAWVYIYTHQGLSYSRAFVQSIILLTIIVTLAMRVIGSNIVIAFGLIGALSVIRFRNILKDTRDTAFIFFSLITGMAIGTGSVKLAILGAMFFVTILLYLHWTGFGSRHTSDGFLRFNIGAEGDSMSVIQHLLHRYCRSTHLMSQRFQENGAGEVAYRLIMRDPTRGDELVEELQEINGVSKITFVLHEEQAEV